jgi:hypothetical protein
MKTYVLIFVFLNISCNSADKSETIKSQANSIKSLENSHAIDSLVYDYDAIIFSSSSRSHQFSYELQEKFKDRVMVTSIRIKDISPLKGRFVLWGSNSNTIFKIHLDHKQLQQWKAINSNRRKQYAVAIGGVKFHKTFSIEADAEDRRDLVLSLDQSQLLVEGVLLDIKK